MSTTPRFADMTWKVVPPEQTGRRAAVITLTVDAKGNGKIIIGRDARERVGIGQTFELLVNGRAIAVRAAPPKSANARKMTKTGQASATAFLTRVLGMTPGERYRLPVTIEEGHAWALLPDTVAHRLQKGRAA